MVITPDDRWVTFSTVFNFRDLGGLSTVDGGRIRRGMLFRSDDLGRLSLDDKETFAALGVRRVIDLRRASEVEQMGRVPEWAGVEWHHHHIDHELWDHGTYSDEIGVARWLADRYRDMLETGGADIARILIRLSEVDDGPTVVHCVAGKDRTGTIVALTLSLIGVSDEDIRSDYALTELSEEGFTAWLRRTDPEMAAKTPPPFYVQTPALAMQLTLAELRERYGSVEEYLAPHGLTSGHAEALRDGLIE